MISCYLVDEFFDPSGCVVDLIHTDGDRSSVILQDLSQSTCLQPFEFSNHRYVARVPVHNPYKRHWTVQISGWNITCHQLQVHVALNGSKDTVVLCQELLPTKRTGDGIVLCSYKCPCFNGCSYLLIDIFETKKPVSLLLCEVEV